MKKYGSENNAQWESARPNLDLPKIEARSEVKLRHLGFLLQNAKLLRFGLDISISVIFQIVKSLLEC